MRSFSLLDWRLPPSATITRWAITAAFVAILLFSLGLRFSLIERSLPYVRHVDEQTWTRTAMRMLKEGDLDPRRFNKPSMMVNLTAAGVALGVLRAGSHNEASSLDDLGGSPRHYYELPGAIKVPKQLFALLSVAAMAMAGLCARIVGGKRWLLVLAPLLVASMPGYLYLSWHYINADILGAFFIAATVTHVLVESTRRPAFAESIAFAALQGALVGLTIGCKYNLFPIALPYVVFSLFSLRDRLLSRWITFGAFILIGFVVSTPYALITPDVFLNGALHEARHYATGHHGVMKQPGWDMFSAYCSHILETCGPLTLLAAVFGAGVALEQNVRLAAIAFSFPVAFMAYMSDQRTFFARNVVSVYLFVAIAAAIALSQAFVWLERLAERRASWAARPAWQRRLAVLAVLTMSVTAALPWSKLVLHYSLEVESRNTAAQYLLKTAGAGAKVFVDTELHLDARGLARRFEVIAPIEGADDLFYRFKQSAQGSYLVTAAAQRSRIDRALEKGAQIVLELGTSTIAAGRTAGHDPKLVVLRR